jgi:2-desacetyl-2-hydroxyethyl bacteriochlorophyllide A dehydrogenase
LNAIILNKPEHFERINIPKPTTLLPHEALVKIHRIGICGTDYHAYKGRQPFFTYPRILGHELGVEVVAIGSKVRVVKVGDKCAVEPYLNCGKCSACQRKKTNCCENLTVLGVHTEGGMTEFITLPADKLHPSAILDYEALALVETLGIGCHAVQRAAVKAKDTVLVIGAGPIGLSVLEFLKLKNIDTAVLDMNKSRLDFCQKHQKANTIIFNDDTVLDKIKQAFNGNLPTIIFDATGNPDSMKNAVNYLGFGGKLVFIGLFQGDYAFHDPTFHRKEMTIMSSRNSLGSDFKMIIKHLESGLMDTQSWVSKRLPFDALIENFDGLLKDETLIKAVIHLP